MEILDVIDGPFIEHLAREAGRIMLQFFSPGGVPRRFKTEDGNTTPVTEADTRINAFVLGALQDRLRRTPFAGDVSLRGEEGSEEHPGARYGVVFDPLDGTIPYAEGIPVSTFMLAVLDRGRPTSCVIFDPFSDQLFRAETGKGATCNSARLRVGEATAFSNKTIVGAVWWNTSPYNIGPMMGALPQEHGASVINLLSIGYMGARVASGQLAATVFPGASSHDSAAIDLLVHEAGGVVTDVEGNLIDHRLPVKGHIAANQALHAQLLQIARASNRGAP
jgi:myo-inositol-1(or 4)-monophosphatase